MKNAREFIKPSPKLSANIISRLFYWWLKDLLSYGYKHDIVASDIYEVLPEHQSKLLCDDLQKVWNEELNSAKTNKEKPSLSRAFVKTYRSLFLKLSIIPACYVIISLLLPLILQQFLLNIDSSLSYAYATLLLVLQMIQTIGLRHSSIELTLLGMRTRVALTSLMYRKITRLSCSSANSNVGGTLVNLMTNDVGMLDLMFFYIPFLVLAPIEMIVTTYILWRNFGYAAFMAVILLALLIFPPQCKSLNYVILFLVNWTHLLTTKYRPHLLFHIDKRISIIGEVINGIQTIKIFGWEKLFEKLVYLSRKREIQVYNKIYSMPCISFAISTFGYRLVGFLTILVYTFQYSSTISPFTILLLVQYMLNMRQTLSQFFVVAFTHMANFVVSIKRIENFLLLDEVTSNVKRIKMADADIKLTNVTVSWRRDSIIEKSLHFDVDFTSNKLHVVVGPVGAGKSTLLKVILDEAQPESGEVIVNGRISYASQDPWLFAASIKENIIFGEKYDEDKYRTVTQACALIEDFRQLPYGDKSLVGERGSNLSGGQCARVSLARAVYRDADIYLLDDPVSAVDAHVANHIFKECINGYLKNKTRILVTNNFQYLKEADEIVLLDDGKVEFKGTFADFDKNEKYYSYLPRNREFENSAVDEKNSTNNESVRLNKPSSDSQKIENNEDEAPKETDELLAKGYVKRSLYLRFIRESGSNLMLFFVVLGFVAGVCSTSAFDYWQVTWTNNRRKNFENSVDMNATKNTTIVEYSSSSMNFSYVETSLFVCGGLITMLTVAHITKNLLFFRVILNACERLHNRMFESLMKTPLRFFQTNAAGRILNRFSKDTGTTDQALVFVLFGVLYGLEDCIAYLVPVLIINVWNVFPSMLVIYLCYKLFEFYIPAIQALKRVETNAKSPVLSLAVTSLSGLSTIRSAESQDLVSQIFDDHQNHHTAANFLTIVTNTSLSIWLDITVFLLWAIVAYSSILLKHNNLFVASLGLALVQLRSIALILQFAVRQVAEVIYHMISVERMFQFVDLEHEPDAEIEPPIKPSNDWPTRGEVVFDKLYLRYSQDAEPVLKNLSFKIEPGMKVGIVGRTGAGKSSLISAIFRFVKFDGTLLIDGIDTKKISYCDLRSRISVIPQEPVLFAGSLRDNLDPKHEFDDASLWSALENVELNKTFDSLDRVIDKGGNSLSTGQRQLLCLARAIVKRNKILVLDEATANVDPATDELIQKTIRTVFKDCTVLTIAHRLNTIMDSDKVLVMSHGEVVEFDHPHILLKQNDGYFFEMVQQADGATSQHLKEIAEQAFKENLIIDYKRSANEK